MSNISETGRLLFARCANNEHASFLSSTTPSDSNNENIDPQVRVNSPSRREERPSSCHREPLASTTAVNAKRPSWRAPMPVADMITESFQCCKMLRCKDRFVDGTNDVNRLGAEQVDLARLTTRKARLVWIQTMVPFQKMTGRARGSMMAGGTMVCNTFFSRAFGVSNNLIENAKKNPGSAFVARRSGKTHEAVSGRRDWITTFIDFYANRFGQHMPHLNATYLYLRSKKELYEHFLEEMKKTHGAATAVSKAFFNKVWRERRSTIKAKTGGTFMKCHPCTIYHDVLNGSAGIRVTADPATVARAEQAYQAHKLEVSKDRDCLERRTAAALRAKANMEPLKFVSIQADAANQTCFALPMCSPVTHGTDKGYAERQKMMAVVVEGQFVEFYLTPQTVGGGSNLICTSIHKALTRLFDLHCKPGTQPYIEELFIQVDNCVGENKNHILIGYLGSLVGRGVVGRAEVDFMIVGHTHILIDQIFSRMSVHCKGMNLFTRQQQAQAFQDAYHELPVHTTTVRSLGNFKGVLMGDHRVHSIRGITAPRAFELRKAGPHQVTVGLKELMHHTNFTGRSESGVYEGEAFPLFRSGIPRVEEAPAWNYKAVPDVIQRNVSLRYKSVHCRVDALYPLDEPKQMAIKAEMDRSAGLLSATGSREWNLDDWWLPREQPVLNPDDDVPGPLSDSGGAKNFGGSPDQEVGQGGLANKEARPSSPKRPVFDKGDFVFFLAPDAPFLVGKVLRERRVDEGDAGAERCDNEGKEDGDEVQVHWWSPVSRSVRDNASDYTVANYGKGVFAPDFKNEGASDDGNKRKRKLVADEEWMASDEVVAACSKLNNGGKKVPKAMLDALDVARHRDMEDIDSDEEEWESDGED